MQISFQSRPTQSASFEYIVAPFSALSSGPKLSAHPARWSREAVKQFQDKVKKSDGTEPSFATRVSFSDGSFVQFLFITPRMSTFELHSGLRSAFEDASRQQSLLLNLRKLAAADQKRALDGFVTLVATQGWGPARFGMKKKEKDKTPESLEVLSGLKKPEALKIATRAQGLGDAINEVRTLVELPTNELYPAAYRKKTESLAKLHGIGFEYWGVAELQKKKAGAFLAVARGDLANGSGIAVLKYKPKRGAKKRIALVGKGLCYDTGGYNLKVSKMYGMHRDMTGSAMALALCAYYARIQAPIEVTAYLAITENLISETAYKPNEVVLASDGTSIEVVDTDAEGRMVLADTLALVRKTKPDLTVDFATLTYTSIRALDTRRSAVFSNVPRLAKLGVEIGEETGERTWDFPIGEDYRKELDSPIADILQCAHSAHADHIYAATFLAHFIGAECPWVHLDLSSGSNKGGLGIIGTETTGFGVRWADALIRAIAKI